MKLENQTLESKMTENILTRPEPVSYRRGVKHLIYPDMTQLIPHKPKDNFTDDDFDEDDLLKPVDQYLAECQANDYRKSKNIYS